MGGLSTFRTAATLPDRIGAAATFHGGGLVTDKPDSRHLLIPQMKAEVLCCVADNDDKRDPNTHRAVEIEKGSPVQTSKGLFSPLSP